MQYCCSGWKCQEGSASLALSCVFLSLPKYSSYFKTVTISLYSFQCLCLVNLLMSLLLWVKLTPFTSVMDNCPTTGSSQTPLPDLTLLVPLFAINRGSMLSIFCSLAQSHSGTWIELFKKYKVRVFYFWLHGTRLCWRRKLCAATPERRRCSQLKSSSILFHYYLWHRTCIHDIYGSIVKPWWNWYNIF